MMRDRFENQYDGTLRVRRRGFLVGDDDDDTCSSGSSSSSTTSLQEISLLDSLHERQIFNDLDDTTDKEGSREMELIDLEIQQYQEKIRVLKGQGKARDYQLSTLCTIHDRARKALDKALHEDSTKFSIIEYFDIIGDETDRSGKATLCPVMMLEATVLRRIHKAALLQTQLSQARQDSKQDIAMFYNRDYLDCKADMEQKLANLRQSIGDSTSQNPALELQNRIFHLQRQIICKLKKRITEDDRTSLVDMMENYSISSHRSQRSSYLSIGEFTECSPRGVMDFPQSSCATTRRLFTKIDSSSSSFTVNVYDNSDHERSTSTHSTLSSDDSFCSYQEISDDCSVRNSSSSRQAALQDSKSRLAKLRASRRKSNIQDIRAQLQDLKRQLEI